jgi:hypothetical protein
LALFSALFKLSTQSVHQSLRTDSSSACSKSLDRPFISFRLVHKRPICSICFHPRMSLTLSLSLSSYPFNSHSFRFTTLISLNTIRSFASFVFVHSTTTFFNVVLRSFTALIHISPKLPHPIHIGHALFSPFTSSSIYFHCKFSSTRSLETTTHFRFNSAQSSFSLPLLFVKPNF